MVSAEEVELDADHTFDRVGVACLVVRERDA
jgi:hypothetical protein